MTTPECPSCHATDGRPHTDYCRLGEGDGYCGISKPNGMACLEPDGHGHFRWSDLFGIDPDYTEGASTEEWLEANHGEA